MIEVAARSWPVAVVSTHQPERPEPLHSSRTRPHAIAVSPGAARHRAHSPCDGRGHPQAAWKTFSRLLADAYSTHARAAIQPLGPLGFQQAFSVLGQLAMQEINIAAGVAASLQAMQQHLDRARLEPLLNPK